MSEKEKPAVADDRELTFDELMQAKAGYEALGTAATEFDTSMDLADVVTKLEKDLAGIDKVMKGYQKQLKDQAEEHQKQIDALQKSPAAEGQDAVVREALLTQLKAKQADERKAKENELNRQFVEGSKKPSGVKVSSLKAFPRSLFAGLKVPAAQVKFLRELGKITG